MDEKEIRVSLQRASERLYADSRLRDGLTDAQAEQLLAWGFRQVEDAAAQAQTLPSAAARERIETRVEAVHDVLRIVSQMVTQLPAASRAQSREYTAQLVEALWKADARRFQSDEISALARVIARRETLAPPEIFERLLAIVRAPAGAETAEADAASGSTSINQAPTAVTPAPSNSQETNPGEEE